jgi:bifunctional UDP-N-acetylglucosamine pyrophosphorylase/glucosamine-1-phosphate N-acetyltransferase
VDSIVEDGASVTFAVAVGAHVGPQAEVGPFASLRSGTRLGRGAKAGTFVETKAADIGEGSKVPHLSYMGDVAIGRDVNVGAGTITCNYNPFELAPDGSTKHRTVIGDDAYISSDTMLVAPVRIGRGAQTGAGAVVNADVPDRTLAFGVPARVRGPAKERARKGEPAKRAAKRSTASAGASKKKGTRASKKAPGRSKRKAR